MACRRVADRLARDFWVRPSEKMVRLWCRAYQASLDFETDYQAWVVSEFSGILCVDEVYQDRLALLLAVDPAAPDGDRLVGYQLVSGPVAGNEVEQFLTRLREAGIEPVEVITDGSSLYPGVLQQVWPQAAHQLCLFHETRRVTTGVMKLVNAVRRSLPSPPPTLHTRGIRSHGLTAPKDLTDLEVQQWQQRRAERDRQIGLVHYLAEQGLSQRAIERQTGFSRPTVKKWLNLARPDLSPEQILAGPDQSQVDIPSPAAVKQNKIRQAHELAQQHLSYSEIGRRVGAHRVTIKKWLQEPVPSEPEPAVLSVPVGPEPPLPPAPWTSWGQVKQVREALKEHRFLLLRRPEHLNEQEQTQVEALLASPVGAELQVGRACLVDWYRIWKDEAGQRRTPLEAKAQYEVWHTNELYAAVPILHKVQGQITPAKFEQLSQFLQQPEWEATNNGAERAGRAFRHRQAPHFNLRSQEAISGTIKAGACLRKEAATRPPLPRLHTCQRGRKQRMVERSSSCVGT
jgi:transposase